MDRNWTEQTNTDDGVKYDLLGLYQLYPRWWLPNIFYFQPYLGKIPILTRIFEMGWNHHLEKRSGKMSRGFEVQKNSENWIISKI